jgi:gas vesicle protein
MDRESSSGFLAGLLVGAVVGAAIGLLYAPQSGHETRRVVKEKAVAAKDSLAKVANRVKATVNDKLVREQE